MNYRKFKRFLRIPVILLLTVSISFNPTYFRDFALAQETRDSQRIEAEQLLQQGIQQYKISQFREALQSWQSALDIFREISDRVGEGETLINLGNFYFKLGQYENAIYFYKKSLAISKKIKNTLGKLLEGRALGSLGNAYVKLGQYEQAVNFYKPALSIFRELGDREEEGRILGNLGSLYLAWNQYEHAIDFYEQRLDLAREVGDRSGEGRSLNNLAIVYQVLKKYDRALNLYEQRLAIAREAGDKAGEGISLANIGQLWESRDQREVSISFLKQSVNIRESIRANISSLSTDLQQSYIDKIAKDYRFLADLLLQEGRVLEAQRVIDLLKVQELDNFLNGVRGNNDSREGIELLEPERLIIEDYNALLDRAIINGRALVALEQKKLAGIALTSQENQQFDNLQAESRTILKLFVSFLKSPEVVTKIALLRQEEGERTIYPRQLQTLQDNLQRLQQNAVLLYPLILEDRLEIVLVTPHADPIHRPVSVTANQLNTTIREFRSALDAPDRDALTPARQLYKWLIEPIESDLQAAGAETIIYSPDRTLRYIPLAALHDGEQWLIERFRINHITAATLSDFNVQPRKQPRILAGAFANGEYSVTVGDEQFPFSGLPYAEIEVEGLKALTQNLTSLFDRDFSRQTIEREANSHTIVHFATHAKFLIGTPQDSFILFGDGSRITLQDINDTGWLSLTNVDLIVLSACETGLDNTFGNGAEILGFGYLMQQPVGARASMASLWAVNDGGTQILMDAFYKALMSGDATTAAALQQAQIALIRAGEGGESASGNGRGGLILAEDFKLDPANLGHPHYWAPFILIGNGL